MRQYKTSARSIEWRYMQHGSVQQCARQCAAVRLAVCGCALGSVQQSGSMAVCGSKAACGSAAVCGNAALYGSARAAVCGSARGGVRQLFGSFR